MVGLEGSTTKRLLTLILTATLTMGVTKGLNKAQQTLNEVDYNFKIDEISLLEDDKRKSVLGLITYDSKVKTQSLEEAPKPIDTETLNTFP